MEHKEFIKQKIDAASNIIKSINCDLEESLIIVCASVFEIEPSHIYLKKKKTSNIMLARKMFCYLAINELGLTQRYLADKFAINQPMVSDYVRDIKNYIESYKDIENKYNHIKQKYLLASEVFDNVRIKRKG